MFDPPFNFHGISHQQTLASKKGSWGQKKFIKGLTKDPKTTIAF